MDDQRLVQLRKKAGESEEEFMARFELSATDIAQWKKITDNGNVYGGPALKRFL